MGKMPIPHYPNFHLNTLLIYEDSLQELREKIGKSAIWHSQRYANELVKAAHDWESIVAKLERIYLEMIRS